MRTAACIASALVLLLPFSLAVPLQLADADPHGVWSFTTGGEVAAAGALSSDGKTFYVGSRCVAVALPPPPLPAHST